MKKLYIILVVIFILSILVACAPPVDPSSSGKFAKPVMETVEKNLYKYEDMSTNMVCYFVEGDVECYKK